MIEYFKSPLPTLPSPAAGLPASGKSKSGQTPAGRGLVRGREQTEFAAALISVHTISL
jgi:hypothetical protein